jgi:hypothetical protein
MELLPPPVPVQEVSRAGIRNSVIAMAGQVRITCLQKDFSFGDVLFFIMQSSCSVDLSRAKCRRVLHFADTVYQPQVPMWEKLRIQRGK